MRSTVDPKEHRRMVRRLVKKTTLGTCQKGNSGLGPVLETRLHDISEDGIRVILKVPMAPGDEIEISITPIGTGRPLTVEAAIVWCSKEQGSGFCVAGKFLSPLSYEAIYHMT